MIIPSYIIIPMMALLLLLLALLLRLVIKVFHGPITLGHDLASVFKKQVEADLDWSYFRVTSNALDSVLGSYPHLTRQHQDHSLHLIIIISHAL